MAQNDLEYWMVIYTSYMLYYVSKTQILLHFCSTKSRFRITGHF